MRRDFYCLLDILVSRDVDFVLVGGFAGVVYGSSYVTEDIDICCDFSIDNLFRLDKAVADLHPVHRMTPNRMKFRLTKENAEHLKNLYLDTDMGQLDCLSCIEGVGDYSKVKQASEIIKFEKVKLRVLNLDNLIKAKQAMNRPKDKQVVIELEAIKESKTKN
jgi:hypothetical protein